MNTPAHAILNLAVLTRGRARVQTWPVFAGAITPDVPMFVFYLWERWIEGHPEQRLWRVLYFREDWQVFIDLFNSIPLALLGLLLAWRVGRQGAVLFFASVLLHTLCDLPLHSGDAHRHFLPFSDFRFQSPVSYWDPARHGAWAALGETAGVCAGSLLLWRRFPHPPARALLLGFAALQVAAYLAFYRLGGLPE